MSNQEPLFRCSKCLLEKPKEEFTRDKSNETGVSRVCRDCQRAARRENASRLLREGAASGRECSRCGQFKLASEFHANRALKSGLHSHCIACDRLDYAADKAAILARSAKYKRERYRSDPGFRLRSRLSSELSVALRGELNGKPRAFKKIAAYVGKTVPELLDQFEKEFSPGMTRDNYGSVWQVDHIVPSASFDHASEAEVLACWHWSNLRPAFKEENQNKGDRVAGGRARDALLKP